MPKKSPLWREAAIGAATYAAVLLVGRAATRPAGREAALKNSRRLYELEKRLGIQPVYRLHQACTGHTKLVKGSHAAYMVMNVGLTAGWLVKLYAAGHPEYRRFRRATVLAALAAQPAFLFFPCAPPRKLEEFVDTGIKVGGVDFESRQASQLYNPLAAMPSIHVTLAVVTAAGIAETTGSRLVKRLIRRYPAAVTLVVIATGNHFVLDTIAGGLLGRAALRLAKYVRQGDPPGRR
ncbi:MAG TPA: phosphatase PAP2 family protein [Candidatus Saccharimonadales bacterium]|nr:phosphatase PAP2 family protein [Candidatus Saccharimonadales bacterium]